MNLSAEALKDLRLCAPALFRFAVATLVALAVFRLCSFSAVLWLPEAEHPELFATAHILASLYLAVAMSAVQAVFLAALGACIDKPLWKSKGAIEALQRFFMPWFIINLFAITLIDIQARLMAADQQEAAAFLELFVIAVHVTALPVGACIMHYGALDWKNMGEALQPLKRLFSLALLPFAVGFLQYTLASARLFAISGNMVADLFFLSVTDIPLIMLEAFIFAMIWRICMHHRSLPVETDNPFDF